MVQLSDLPPFPVERALSAAAERHEGKWRRMVGEGGGGGAATLVDWLRERAESNVRSTVTRARKL